MNNFKIHLSRSALLGNDLFKGTMSRYQFLLIRACLQLYPKYEPDFTNVDPLWHQLYLLEHVQQNDATMAVPTGVSSLEENTIRCKGRTAARTYMKSKPVKFGIRFYAIVGRGRCYLHSIFDNGSGNKTGQSPVMRYTSVFQDLRRPVENSIDGSIVAKGSASVLWCAQAAHQTKVHLTPQHGRLLVMDNFYTRHTLAPQMNGLSDGEMFVLGTVLNLIDAINRPVVNNAVESLNAAERESWMLYQSFNFPAERNGAPTVATKSGLIVLKDRLVVTLYINYLSDTPSQRIQRPSDHSILFVHGVFNMSRWLGGEILSRSELYVPALVVSYNLFMNGVDRFDQYRSTSLIRQQERRVVMSMFTFILDASLVNVHAVLSAISSQGATVPDLVDIKIHVFNQLEGSNVSYRNVPRTIRTRCKVGGNSMPRPPHGSQDMSSHILLEN